MSYVPVYARGGVPRLAGLGADPAPTDVTIIVRQALASQGMNNNQLQAIADRIMERYNADMKRQALEQAAVNAGITIALACIPVIGWIIEAVWVVVQIGLQITNVYYKNEAAKVINDMQNELRSKAAEYEARLALVKDAVMEQEKPAAIQLALSNTTLTGLGELFWKKPWQPALATVLKESVIWSGQLAKPLVVGHHLAFRTIDNILLKVPIPAVQDAAKKMGISEADWYADVKRTEQQVEDFIDVGTGEAKLAKAKEAAAKARAAALVEFERQFQIAVANVNSAPFREAVRNALAVMIRTDPAIMQMIGHGLDVSSQSPNMAPTLTVVPPAKALQAAPMMATAAAAAAALFLFNK